METTTTSVRPENHIIIGTGVLLAGPRVRVGERAWDVNNYHTNGLCIAKHSDDVAMMMTWLSGSTNNSNSFESLRLSTVKFGYLLRAYLQHYIINSYRHTKHPNSRHRICIRRRIFGRITGADSRSQLDRLNYRDCWVNLFRICFNNERGAVFLRDEMWAE